MTNLAHSYLNLAQIHTINSYKLLNNNGLYELNYTADYKLDELLAKITNENIEYGQDMRQAMHDLLAPASDIAPEIRLSNKVPGCTSVVAQDKDTGAWLIGRNYDLDTFSNGSVAIVHTAPQGKYKSVGISDTTQLGLSKNYLAQDKELMLYAPYYTMDGVNEKGLAVSIMVLSKENVVQNEEGKESLPSSMLVRYLLDNADSVQGAIKLLNEHNLKLDALISYSELQEQMRDNISYHWAISDASGDKAIIEYVDGKINVLTALPEVEYNEQNYEWSVSYPNELKPYLVSTNFFLSQEIEKTSIEEGFWRYSTSQKELAQNPNPTKNELIDIMKKVKYFMNDKDYEGTLVKKGADIADPQNWEWITIWTDILDTKEKNLKLFYREDYGMEYDANVELSGVELINGANQSLVNLGMTAQELSAQIALLPFL